MAEDKKKLKEDETVTSAVDESQDSPAAEKAEGKKAGPDHLHEKDEDTKKRSKSAQKSPKQKKEKKKPIRRALGMVKNSLAAPKSYRQKHLAKMVMGAGVSAVFLTLATFAASPVAFVGMVALGVAPIAGYVWGVKHEKAMLKAAEEKSKKKSGPEGGGQKQKPGNEPKPGAKPKVKGQDRDGQEAKAASGQAKPESMDKSHLTGDEAQAFYNGPTRQKQRIAEAEKKRAAKADKARAEEARKLAEGYLATENKARMPVESFDGGALKGGGGKPKQPEVIITSADGVVREKRRGVGFGIGRGGGK